MAKTTSTEVGTCAYCHAHGEVTQDHILSHCLFPKDTTSLPELPKAHACRKCNNGFSAIEDEARLAFIAETPLRQTDVYATSIRSIEKNGRLKRETKRAVQPTYVRSEGGLWIPGSQHHPDLERLKPVFRKFVMGLYHRGTKKFAPLDLTILDVCKYTALVEPDLRSRVIVQLYNEAPRDPVERIVHDGLTLAEWQHAPMPDTDGVAFPAQGFWYFRFHEAAEWLVSVGSPALAVAGGSSAR